jgi:hypothetical protein
MAGEEIQEVSAPTPEEEAAADAAFAAGFADARGDAPAAEPEVIADEVQPQPEVETQPAAAEEDAAPAAPAEPAPAPEDDENAPVAVSRKDFARLMELANTVPTLQEELRTTRDKTAGRLGSLQQMVDAVKAQASAGRAFSVPQLKRLREEYGDLADILAEDLGEAFAQPAPAAPAAEAAPVDDNASGDAPGAEATYDPFADPRVQERLQQQEEAVRNSHLAVVSARHPDWIDLRATPEFAEWRNNLPAPAQELLASTWDSSVLTDAIADFKGWRDKRNASASASKQRDNRLENAIPATTGRATGAHVVDEDAEFMKGFKTARNGR